MSGRVGGIRGGAIILFAIGAARADSQRTQTNSPSCVPLGAAKYSTAELSKSRTALLDSIDRKSARVRLAAWETRLDSILARLVQASHVAEVKPSLVIVDNKAFGAAARAGGVIVVYDGALTFIENVVAATPGITPEARREREQALAAVLIAHELAHITLAHLNYDTSRRETIDLTIDSSGEYRVSQATADARSRAQQCEFDADRVGALYVSRAAGNVQSAIDLFRAARQASIGAPPTGNAVWYTRQVSSHPAWGDRVSALTAFLSQLQRNEGRYENAELQLRSNAHLQDAADSAAKILDDFPDLVPALHLRAAIEHQRWLNSVPLELQRVRGALTTVAARSFPEIKGVPGDTALLNRARLWYGAVLQRAPLVQTLTNLALLDAYAANFSRAEALVRRADSQVVALPAELPLRPWLVAATHNNAGVVAFLAGRFTEARRRFENAVASDSMFPQALYNLARTADTLGDARAVQLLSAYLKYDEHSDWAIDVRRRLARHAVATSTGAPAAALPPPSVAGVTLGMSLEQAQAKLGSLGNVEGSVSDFPSRGIRLTRTIEDGITAIEVYGGFTGEIERLHIGDVAAATRRLGRPSEVSADGTSTWQFTGANWYLSVQLESARVARIGIRPAR